MVGVISAWCGSVALAGRWTTGPVLRLLRYRWAGFTALGNGRRRWLWIVGTGEGQMLGVGRGFDSHYCCCCCLLIKTFFLAPDCIPVVRDDDDDDDDDDEKRISARPRQHSSLSTGKNPLAMTLPSLGLRDSERDGPVSARGGRCDDQHSAAADKTTRLIGTRTHAGLMRPHRKLRPPPLPVTRATFSPLACRTVDFLVFPTAATDVRRAVGSASLALLGETAHPDRVSSRAIMRSSFFFFFFFFCIVRLMPLFLARQAGRGLFSHHSAHVSRRACGRAACDLPHKPLLTPAHAAVTAVLQLSDKTTIPRRRERIIEEKRQDIPRQSTHHCNRARPFTQPARDSKPAASLRRPSKMLRFGTHKMATPPPPPPPRSEYPLRQYEPRLRLLPPSHSGNADRACRAPANHEQQSSSSTPAAGGSSEELGVTDATRHVFRSKARPRVVLMFWGGDGRQVGMVHT
ncbi:hypothetical protein B0J12DRAFT_326753 [Macrophomina phaseolina]|uniref:Uncharacterized protein n=1 Tax=Macrophomina phaseolina TaxID=35725 RepID=A0ABQ8FY14_9PEZI|nr:hypothetical protein B0J12DRAFT_326753 [Macrophomina phaseolina]